MNQASNYWRYIYAGMNINSREEQDYLDASYCLDAVDYVEEQPYMSYWGYAGNPQTGTKLTLIPIRLGEI